MLDKIKVGILDLGINNIQSVFNSFKISGYKVYIAKITQKKFNYDILVLPGVGAFPTAMNIIKKNKVDEKLLDFTNKQNNLLYGICLGMQILFDQSDEFKQTKGIGLIKGKVLRFKKKIKKNNFNIGWRPLTKNKNVIFRNDLNDKLFYFVHGFYVKSYNQANTSHFSFFNGQKFSAIVKKNNIIGTQFHPEKSGKDGIKFITNISKLI